MAVTQKSFKVFTASDGATFSELDSQFLKNAKKRANAHELRITLSQRRRAYDVLVAEMFGIKVGMEADAPELTEDDYTWYEDDKGPWDGPNGLYAIMNKLDDSFCPGDIDNMSQFVWNIQQWVKVIPGGLDMIAKLNALKIDKDLL